MKKEATTSARKRGLANHSGRRVVVLVDKYCQDSAMCHTIMSLRTEKAAWQLNQTDGSSTWANLLVTCGLAVARKDDEGISKFSLTPVGLKMACELFKLRESAIDYLRSRSYQQDESSLRSIRPAISVLLDDGDYKIILSTRFSEWLSRVTQRK